MAQIGPNASAKTKALAEGLSIEHHMRESPKIKCRFS
jgi:hypothetical protein